MCLVAGIGNALFRIGGRHDVLRRCWRRAAWLGAFVSPGAFGLFLGGLLGGGTCPVWPVPTALALSAAWILCLCPPVSGARQAPLADAGARPWLIGLVLLFLVVCLRSRREALKDDLRFVMSTGSACRSLRTVRFPAPRPAIPRTRSRPPRPKGLAPRRPYAFASKQRPLGMGATSDFSDPGGPPVGVIGAAVILLMLAAGLLLKGAFRRRASTPER